MKKLMKSFYYAFTGIHTGLKSERNMKIHVTIACFVTALGIIVKLKWWEFIICLLCFAMVIGAELFNTAIEITVDLVTKEQNELAKKAKDIAAGAVLTFAIFAAIIGFILFIPKIIALF